MAEIDVFERSLGGAFLRLADDVPGAVDAAAVAHRVALEHPRPRTTVLRWRVAAPRRACVLLLLAGLLAALVGGMLVVGSQTQRRLPAVVPNLGPVATCPPGSRPDEPGPVDQVVPPVYGWSPVAFDRRAGKLIALAANTEGSQETWTVETWTFDVCTNTWTRMHPKREPPALVSRLVYDVDSDLTIGVHYEDWRDPYVIGNVWAYDLEANTWTEHGVAPTDAPGFYDPVSGRVVAGGVAGGLWNYDVQTDKWTPINQAIPREALGFSEYVYDTSVDRIIEYAGGGSVAEAWIFDPRTGAWSKSGVATPFFRMGMWALPTIVYDEAAGRTVVAGDFQWGTYNATADRWEILFDAPGGTVGKPAAYDPVNRRLIVFGGGMGVSGYLVAFDLVTREWTVLLEPGTGRPTP